VSGDGEPSPLGAGAASAALAGLVVSSAALVSAPRLMPPSYSWLAHTTSESAAQGVPGAWLARAGFLLLGCCVIVIAVVRRARWGRWGVGLHAAFGALMIATGIFSARPWEPGLPFSPVEDLLHSVAATSLGFAFAVGVVLVAWRHWRDTGAWRLLDVTAVTASVVLPLAMLGFEPLTGALQRVMFLLAYLWYGREACSRPQ